MTDKGVPPQIWEIANLFWQQVIQLRTFPIDIERAIACSNLPIHINIIPGLDIDRVEQWIQLHSFPARLNIDNCALHGFLLAYKGHGVIFINGTDTIEERRFTVAHELAHFLLDYHLPRIKLLNRYGHSILEVINGERAATIEERLKFIISDLPAPLFSHSLEYKTFTVYDHDKIWKNESRADTLAVEILATLHIVTDQLKKSKTGKRFDQVLQQAASILINYFGLPFGIALGYARHIARTQTGGTTLAEEWGIE